MNKVRLAVRGESSDQNGEWRTAQCTLMTENKTDNVLPDIHQQFTEARQHSANKQELSEGRLKYKLSVVSYLDILGMKTLLTDAGSDPEKVARVLRIARRFSTPDAASTEAFGWTYTNFSDLILRTVPVLNHVEPERQRGVVFQELFDLGHIQINLLFNNVLIRGALTLGSITVNRELVFGPALAQANLLESKCAKFPRIVIDPIVFTTLKENPLLRAHEYRQEMRYVRGLLTRDADGVWFLDYLRWIFDNADNNSQYGEAICRHKALVCNQLRESRALDGRTREGRSRRKKAEWLRKYHNRHVRTLRAAWLRDETGVKRAELLI